MHNKTIYHYLQQGMQAELSSVLSRLHGYHLLYLDTFFQPEILSASPINNRCYLTDNVLFKMPYIAAQDFNNHAHQQIQSVPTYVLGNYDALPFTFDTIDLIVSGHIFDYAENPFEILQEFWRVIAPEGHLIIFGFNPHSLFGVPAFAKENKKTQHLMTPASLRHMLLNLNFTLLDYKTFCFRPFIKNEQIFKRLKFLEGLGCIFWPYYGAIYLFILKKTVISVTPIRLRWQWQQVLEPKPSMVQPTPRGTLK